jgi:hypothetical protein
MSGSDRPLSESLDEAAKSSDVAPDLANPVIQPEPDRPGMTEDRESVHDVIEAPPAPQASAAPIAQKPAGGGFVGMVLGGALAFAAGYGVSIYYPFAQNAADSSAQEQAIAALAAKVAALESAKPAVTEDRMTALEQKLTQLPASPDFAPLEQAVTQVEQRVAALEAMPMGSGDGAASPALIAKVQSLQDQIEGLKGMGAETTAEIEKVAADAKARLAEAEAQAAALKTQAEATAKKALGLAAIGRIQAALETGTPYSAALSVLGDVGVPDVLRANAEAGIPSQSALEDAFPDAARAALEASLHANMGSSWTERLSAFAQSTTGARSLTPREGSDPDAILSRAEAALHAGNLESALSEIAALPEVGKTAMADWVSKAQLRMDATGALAALSANVEG